MIWNTAPDNSLTPRMQQTFKQSQLPLNPAPQIPRLAQTPCQTRQSDTPSNRRRRISRFLSVSVQRTLPQWERRISRRYFGQPIPAAERGQTLQLSRSTTGLKDTWLRRAYQLKTRALVY